MESTPSPFAVVSPKRALRYLLVAAAVVGVLAIIASYIIATYSQPPADFPVATPITIEPGSSISEIVSLFSRERVVASELLLYAILLTQYTPSDIKASTYVFDQPYDVFTVADKLATGDFTSNLVRITHREGEPVRELALAVHEAIPAISVEEFTAKALREEGYLFPETYFVPPHYTAEEIITTLKQKHEDFMLTRRQTIAAGTLSERDIIILASIVEREANSEESMGMVAGILQNRIALDMPLQADASIEYDLGKPLSELTADDLKRESPYNTYLNRGLPPTPIGNPGAMAINAVINPTPSDYLFYITGDDGTFHYATNFDDHRRNIARYLR